MIPRLVCKAVDVSESRAEPRVDRKAAENNETVERSDKHGDRQEKAGNGSRSR